MKTRTLTVVEWLEAATAPLKVDWDRGVIENVKILGLKSRNGRRYTEKAVRGAVKLYEGAKVNIDHPADDPTDSRSSYDRFGRLSNVHFVDGDGLYGDLQFLKSHPMARQVCEAAKRMPDLFGLSHNAAGDGEEDDGGTFVVDKIIEVRHVDVVADPATTTSLSEGTMTKNAKRNKTLASKGRKSKVKSDRKPVKRDDVAEGDDEDDDKASEQDSMGDDDEGDEDDDEKHLEMCDDEDCDHPSHDKTEGDDEDETEEDDDYEEDEDVEEDEEEETVVTVKGKRGSKVAKESVEKQLKNLRRKLFVEKLCSKHGVKLTRDQLSDCMVGSPGMVRRYVEAVSAGSKSRKPKSGVTGDDADDITEGFSGRKPPKESKDVAAYLLG